MKALVICDQQFDLQNGFKSLQTELKQVGIELISFSDGNALASSMIEFSDDPVLFYPNVWTRYEQPDKILQFHYANRNFESLRIRTDESPFAPNREVTFYPRNIACYNNTILNYKQLTQGAAGVGVRFEITSCQKSTVRPAIESPRIFVNCHRRATYLDLTLKSLKHSLMGTEKITLLLNEPSDEVREVAQKFATGENTDILEIAKNCFYSSLNLGLQWYRPERFLILEDDFILPPTVKLHYPNWIYQFGARLDKYNIVGWGPTTDNSPPFHRYSRVAATTKHFGDWEYKSENKPVVLGNAICTHLDFYLSVLKREHDHWYTALDSKLHKYADDYCTPTLKGYHIGWNQEMDLIPTATGHDFKPPVKNVVCNLKTRETREMALENILL